METSKKKLVIYIAAAIAIVVIIIILLKCCQQNNVTSYFSKDDEGWQILGDAQEGVATPNYQDTEGNPGGYVSANDDAAGGVWYWNAPEKFLGNKTAIHIRGEFVVGEDTGGLDNVVLYLK